MESIAHYRISSKIGEGGMGAVYRATDTKLNREVAVKVLPDAFAEDADRLARFAREAQVLASLNHPNIAAIHGVEERALILELVEGPTLAARIAAGAIPFEEAIPIARQIAEALEYAHERGIVHRDLKPANVKITPEGRVKVLDFGLAKALAAENVSTSHANSPTLTMRATVAGVILGTAAYMSPEQAKGKPVDRRADIWAFGAVLAEMLTGRMVFSGETVSDTLAAVLTRDPEISESLPAHVRALLRRCLDRDPMQRLRDIGEARVALERPAAVEPEPATAPRQSHAPWIAAAALAIAGAVSAMGWWRATRPISRPLVRLNVDLGPEAMASLSTTAAISRDGSRLVFGVSGPGGVHLATRLLGEPKAVVLPGTESGTDPFFSPDGEWIGFFAGGKMKKVSAQGGAAVTLCDAPTPRGSDWGEDGNIILAQGSTTGLASVPSGGGAVTLLSRPAEKGQSTHRWPQILPGGKSILFTGHNGYDFENAEVDVFTLATGKWKTVMRGAYYGRYLPTGHLIYVHQGTLFGVRFDLDKLEARGAPIPLVEDVGSNSTYGSGQLAFTQSGTLIYPVGQTLNLPVVWLDQAGKTEPLLAAPGFYLNPRLSLDGTRLALIGLPISPTDIFIYDWKRQSQQRLTFGQQTNLGYLYPVWTPDGKHIVFASQGTDMAIWWKRSDGAGEAQRLLSSKTSIRPYSFSPDGRRLAYQEINAVTSADIMTVTLDLTDPDHPKAGAPETLLATSAMERAPAISPDGHWMAYESTESGFDEILVRPFPGPGGRWQISTGGGQFPVWSRTGQQLFFENPEYQIMVADYTAKGESFETGAPRLWCKQRLVNTGVLPNMDISPDGKRFATTTADIGEGRSTVHVAFLLNFFDELKRRLP